MPKPMKGKEEINVVVVRKRFLWLIVITLLTAMISPIGCYVYVNAVDRQRASDERENDREWCELITLYTDYYKNNPPNPANPLAVKQAELMFRRYETLGCSHK